jgi:hypothetical protein
MGHRTRWLAITVVALVLSVCIALLVTGSRWLAMSVLPEVPAGTFIAWLALILRCPRTAVRTTLALAAVWGLVSWALAGNLRFEFVDAPLRMPVWQVFTAAIPIATLAGAVAWFLAVRARHGPGDENRPRGRA